MVVTSEARLRPSLERGSNVALNLVYRNDNKKNRVQVLAATHGSGEPVISLDGQPAVTITGSGDYVKSEVILGVGTLSGIPAGGVGLTGKEVTLAFDGTWEFLASSFTGTAPVPGSIANGTAIYITSANALTTTQGSNLRFGSVDFPKEYDKTRGYVPVKIGAR